MFDSLFRPLRYRRPLDRFSRPAPLVVTKAGRHFSAHGTESVPFLRGGCPSSPSPSWRRFLVSVRVSGRCSEQVQLHLRWMISFLMESIWVLWKSATKEKKRHMVNKNIETKSLNSTVHKLLWIFENKSLDVHTHILSRVLYMLVKSCLEFGNHLILLSAHFTQLTFPLLVTIQSLQSEEQATTSTTFLQFLKTKPVELAHTEMLWAWSSSYLLKWQKPFTVAVLPSSPPPVHLTVCSGFPALWGSMGLGVRSSD